MWLTKTGGAGLEGTDLVRIHDEVGLKVEDALVLLRDDRVVVGDGGRRPRVWCGRRDCGGHGRARMLACGRGGGGCGDGIGGDGVVGGWG